jgi:hypothetical protein
MPQRYEEKLEINKTIPSKKLKTHPYDLFHFFRCNIFSLSQTNPIACFKY